MAAKKTPREGLFLSLNRQGFTVLGKQNQHKLFRITGYNTKQNTQKGLAAIHRLLDELRNPVTGKYKVIDLTKKS